MHLKQKVNSLRKRGWDYSQNAGYFITISTPLKTRFFGDIPENKMHLSEEGKLAEKFWLEIPNQFPYAEIAEFVIMPDHMHGILIVNKTSESAIKYLEALNLQPHDVDFLNESNKKNGGVTGEKNPMLHQDLSRIIRWYKGRCTFEIRKINAAFQWTSKFHDQIIWNNRVHQNVVNYILNNPKNWKHRKIK